jgi:glycosyltransferase involved in cell wall biosynthesis
MKTPFFTIVIPTLNEQKYLPNLLRDLNKQGFDQFEVVHVDGSSDDQTVLRAEKVHKKYPFKTVVVKERNVSFQRNIGINLAKGSWIIFMDADNRLPKYFLEGIKYRISRDESFSVFSCWIDSESNSRLEKVVVRAINAAMELSDVVNKTSAFGAMIGIKRELTKHVKFDVTQKVMEDNFFIQSAIAKGAKYKLIEDPKYIFSLRRYKKEGTLKMIAQSATIALQYLQNKGFDKNNYGYVMQGGSYYDQKNASFLSQLQSIIKDASKKQLRQAKKLLGGWKV